MKNKGFTLIELLVVITLLAIISLITVPKVLNIINTAQDESNEISLRGYVDSLKNVIKQYELNKGVRPKGTFTTIDGKTLVGNSILEINHDGAQVICSTIDIYMDSTVYLEGCKVNESSKEYTYGVDKSYDNGQIVYFDVTTGKKCTNYHEDNSITEYNGIYEGDNSTITTENQNGCLKFYAFNDEYGDKINLILDHNTTIDVAWSNSTITVNGPKEALRLMYNDTKDWVGTEILEDYTMDQRGQVSNAYYTIEYSKTPNYEGATTPYKARLVEAQEIAKITGADKALGWDETKISNWYYFDGAKSIDSTWQTQVANETNQSEYYWLFDSLLGCYSYGCTIPDNETFGYWTSASAPGYNDNSINVIFTGSINFQEQDSSNNSPVGIRPVIEVSKSKLLK